MIRPVIPLNGPFEATPAFAFLNRFIRKAYPVFEVIVAGFTVPDKFALNSKAYAILNFFVIPHQMGIVAVGKYL